MVPLAQLANSEGLQSVVSCVFTRFANIFSPEFEINCDQPVLLFFFFFFFFWGGGGGGGGVSSAVMPYNFEPKAMKKITAKAKISW